MLVVSFQMICGLSVTLPDDVREFEVLDLAQLDVMQ
jgi:hypothetical protein